MHCNSTFISSVVRSTFTNMNSPINKNVRLCAFLTLVREMLDVGGLEGMFVQGFMYGFSREVFAWSNFACDAIALREGLLWLGSYDSALSKEKFNSIRPIDYKLTTIANY